MDQRQCLIAGLRYAVDEYVDGTVLPAAVLVEGAPGLDRAVVLQVILGALDESLHIPQAPDCGCFDPAIVAWRVAVSGRGKGCSQEKAQGGCDEYEQIHDEMLACPVGPNASLVRPPIPEPAVNCRLRRKLPASPCRRIRERRWYHQVATAAVHGRQVGGLRQQPACLSRASHWRTQPCPLPN